MPVYSIPNVNTTTWCGSVLEPGVVLTGIDVWKQRCYIVLNTTPGTDPLRPLFGCDYKKHLDGGITTGAMIKKEIIDALKLWVPEVTVKKVTYKADAGVLVFNINLVIAGNKVSLPFSAGKLNFFGGIAGQTIVNTGYKWYWDNMTPALKVDSLSDNNGLVNATPAVPGTLPWSDIPGIMVWIRANWGAYGVWGLGKDEVILYLDKGYRRAELGLTRV